MIGLPTFLSDCLVLVLRQYFLVGFPKVAVKRSRSVFRRDFLPQTAACFLTTVSQSKSNDLPCSATNRSPQPALIDLFQHKTPSFIKFQHVSWLGRQQNRFQRRANFGHVLESKC